MMSLESVDSEAKGTRHVEKHYPLTTSFNGKPQASLPDFAYACGSPLNENAQDNTQSTPCQGSRR
jgi:hypothetical protein